MSEIAQKTANPCPKHLLLIRAADFGRQGSDLQKIWVLAQILLSWLLLLQIHSLLCVGSRESPPPLCEDLLFSSMRRTHTQTHTHTHLSLALIPIEGASTRKHGSLVREVHREEHRETRCGELTLNDLGLSEFLLGIYTKNEIPVSGRPHTWAPTLGFIPQQPPT